MVDFDGCFFHRYEDTSIYRHLLFTDFPGSEKNHLSKRMNPMVYCSRGINIGSKGGAAADIYQPDPIGATKSYGKHSCFLVMGKEDDSKFTFIYCFEDQ